MRGHLRRTRDQAKLARPSRLSRKQIDFALSEAVINTLATPCQITPKGTKTNIRISTWTHDHLSVPPAQNANAPNVSRPIVGSPGDLFASASCGPNVLRICHRRIGLHEPKCGKSYQSHQNRRARRIIRCACGEYKSYDDRTSFGEQSRTCLRPA